ncbi:MAG TPA: ATP-binding cassette domain-containing protein [Euryarchaeota archaeon]|nr:ATP-binding cassette domain-containing protein [Euryarchaeota archaeon]
MALDGADLKVKEGELFGLLGPNGAGKTTLVKILATLLLPSSGKVHVAGYDVDKDPQRIRSHISMVSGGETSGYGLLTVKENIWMFSQFYGVPSKVANQRMDELLKVVGMEEKRNAKVRTLSTGQRQKMNLVRGLVTDPQILFLDEPTLGLDVNAARIIREYIRKWVDEKEKRTVLLTTHYMYEADELCDRIAIIDRGKIIACDTPEGLRRYVDEEAVMNMKVTLLPDSVVSKIQKIEGVRDMSTRHDAQLGISSLKIILDDEIAISQIMDTVVKAGSSIQSLKKTEPTLEDVFLALVGRGLHE